MKEKKNAPWGRSSYEEGFVVVHSIAEIFGMFKGSFHTLSLVPLFKLKVKRWSWVQFAWISIYGSQLVSKANQMWTAIEINNQSNCKKHTKTKQEKNKLNNFKEIEISVIIS